MGERPGRVEGPARARGPGQAPDRVLVYSPLKADEYAEGLRSIPYLQVRLVRSSAEALAAADWPEIFFGAGLRPHALRAMPNLRWIQWIWAGVDLLMADPEFAAALDAGRFRLSRAVGVFGRPIAEYVLAYCLCLTQDMPRALAQQRRKIWQRFETEPLRGRLMGIAGLGSIGTEVARRAAGLGLRVTGLTRSGTAPVAAAPFVEATFDPAHILDFVRDLDFLVLALPLTPETRGLIGARVLAAMKPSATMVNVGRGALVDEGALVEALKAGRPGRAVLDVFEREPLAPESELWSLPNVIITPHLAAASQPADILPLFKQNLESFRAGGPLAGEVRAARGY